MAVHDETWGQSLIYCWPMPTNSRLSRSVLPRHWSRFFCLAWLQQIAKLGRPICSCTHG